MSTESNRGLQGASKRASKEIETEKEKERERERDSGNENSNFCRIVWYQIQFPCQRLIEMAHCDAANVLIHTVYYTTKP